LDGEMLRTFIVSALAVTLIGCAKSPSSIAPTSVATSDYEHLGCDELSDEHNAVSGKLALAESRQNDAQTMDAVGVFLVLIPPSALTGDSEGVVAQYKGEKLAIERSRKKKNC
jgi:hypothetical protein